MLGRVISFLSKTYIRKRCDYNLFYCLEIDFLASPVRPTTFTKFLEAIESDEEHPSSPKSLGTQDTIQSPTLPTIQTPAGNKTAQFVNSPMLPVLQTPGLGSKTTATSTQWNYLNTPPPPVIQSCKLLRLGRYLDCILGDMNLHIVTSHFLYFNHF